MKLKMFIAAFALLITIMVSVGLAVEQPYRVTEPVVQGIHAISMAEQEPSYEVSLVDYLSAISLAQERSDYCHSRNFISSVEKFQNAIEIGNLAEVKRATNELTASTICPTMAKKDEQMIKEASDKLLQSIALLEDENQITHPIAGHFDLLNVNKRYIESRNDGGGPSGD